MEIAATVNSRRRPKCATSQRRDHAGSCDCIRARAVVIQLFSSGRRLRREVDVDRAVAVLDGMLIIRVKTDDERRHLAQAIASSHHQARIDIGERQLLVGRPPQGIVIKEI